MKIEPAYRPLTETTPDVYVCYHKMGYWKQDGTWSEDLIGRYTIHHKTQTYDDTNNRVVVSTTDSEEGLLPLWLEFLIL